MCSFTVVWWDITVHTVGHYCVQLYSETLKSAAVQLWSKPLLCAVELHFCCIYCAAISPRPGPGTGSALQWQKTISCTVLDCTVYCTVHCSVLYTVYYMYCTIGKISQSELHSSLLCGVAAVLHRPQLNSVGLGCQSSNHLIWWKSDNFFHLRPHKQNRAIGTK